LLLDVQCHNISHWFSCLPCHVLPWSSFPSFSLHHFCKIDCNLPWRMCDTLTPSAIEYL
jgi:hypothetical protein